MSSGRLAAFDEVVFDFDGTLAHLDIDWDGLRQAALAEFPDLCRVATAPRFGEIAALASERGGWSARRRLATLLQRFEQPGGIVRSTPIRASVHAARELHHFHVISNNLTSTVRMAMSAMDPALPCRHIVGFDSMLHSKPAQDGFRALAEAVPLGHRVAYIGDRASDRLFAEACGLAFLHVSELCA